MGFPGTKHKNKSLWSCAWFVWYVTISAQIRKKHGKGTKLFPARPSHQGKSYNHPNTLRGKNITLCKLPRAEEVQREREKTHALFFVPLFPTIVLKYTRLMRLFHLFVGSRQQEPRHSNQRTLPPLPYIIDNLDRRDDFLLLLPEVSHSRIKRHLHHIHVQAYD